MCKGVRSVPMPCVPKMSDTSNNTPSEAIPDSDGHRSYSSSLLIAAETATANGQHPEAIKLYEQAISKAQSDIEKAKASEAFARFWLKWGNQRIAATYMQDACNLYQKGANPQKQKQLEAAYHDLMLAVGTEQTPLPQARITTLPNIDLVTQAAQEIIGELELESLIDKIILIATQNTGADSAVLLLTEPQSNTLNIAAENRYDAPPISYIKAQALSDDSPLAIELVRLCNETNNYMIYNHTGDWPELFSASHMESNHPKSILCAPLITKGTLIGVLYLENHNRENAFDHSRVTTIKLIVALAAISLENARLYQARKTADMETRDLKRQLMVSQKMDSIGHLIGGVTHDFNNVINAIYGFCDLSLQELEDGLEHCDESFLRENIEATLESAERAASLARQLLLFSRHHDEQPALLDLNKVISSLEKMLYRLIGERFCLHLELGENMSALYADPSQLEQVVMNFVLNARDAMPDGGTITISTRSVEESDSVFDAHPEMPRGSMAELIVNDTGHGISQQVQSMIFEPFFTTKAVGKGTGLGLATTQAIIKEYSGYIYCDSCEGKGTSFTVYLPSTEQTAKQGSEKNAEALPHGYERILLVDDEVFVREVTSQLLQKLGYRVTEAANAEEAMNIVTSAETSFDMVITDVIMQGMNGVEFTAALCPLLPHAKIMYISGYPESFIADQKIKLPNNILLSKPFSTATIAKAMRSILDDKQ
ncbi:ATP-binding protein [Pseudomonadota bacterium]